MGAAIFFREVQGVWPEIAPFADWRALASAERLDVGTNARSLARLVDDDTLARLVAALVRVDRKRAAAEVRAAARAA